MRRAAATVRHEADFEAWLGFWLVTAAFLAIWMTFDVFGAGTAHFWGYAIVFVLFYVPTLLVVDACRSRRMALVSAATAAVAVLLAFVPWHPKKLFVSRLYSVSKGMTVDEVEDVMGGYLKGAGAQWVIPEGPAPAVRGPGDPEDADAAARAAAAYASYQPPTFGDGEERAHATGTMTYRWTNNADWGQVTFLDGRVVRVAFLPD